jgi:hypothetical protein
VEVMASSLTAVRVNIVTSCREHPMPRPGTRSFGVFDSGGSGKFDVAGAGPQVFFVLRTNLGQVVTKARANGDWE